MSMLEDFGVECVQASPELTIQRWTVTEAFTQPHGVLHGGIAAAIAEQGASLGASLAAGDGYHAVGLALQVQHLLSVPLGAECEMEARPVRAGKRIHVWQVIGRILPEGTEFHHSTMTLYIQPDSGR